MTRDFEEAGLRDLAWRLYMALNSRPHHWLSPQERDLLARAEEELGLAEPN